MEMSRGRTAWLAVAAAAAGFLAEAVVAGVPGSPLQPVLAPGAEAGGPFAWIAETIGLDGLGNALPVASVLGVAAGMAGFLVLLRAAWRGELSMRVALGLSIAFHLAVVLLPLLISRDVYSYIAHGQIVSVHHANPYVQTPADFPGFLTRNLVGPQWVDTPSVYGPLFTQIAGVVTRTTDRLDVLVDLFRLLAIAASLATTFVIAAVASRVRPDRAVFAIAAFGLNPVILFQSAGSGHNDLLVALAIAIAAWCVVRDRSHLAVGMMACAGLVKATAFLPLLLLIVWVVWRRSPEERLRVGATHAAVALAVIAVVAAPFLQLHDPTLGMLELSSHEGWLAPSRFFRRVLDAISGDTLGVVARVAFAIAIVGAVVWLVRAVARAAASGRPTPELLGVGMGAARPDVARPGPPPVVPGLVPAADLDPPAGAARLPDRTVRGARALAMDGRAAPLPRRVRREHPHRSLRAHADRDRTPRVARDRPTTARVDPARAARRGRPRGRRGLPGPRRRPRPGSTPDVGRAGRASPR